MFTIMASLLMYTFWFKDVDFECAPTSLMEHVVNFLNVSTITSSVLFAIFFYPNRNCEVISQKCRMLERIFGNQWQEMKLPSEMRI